MLLKTNRSKFNKQNSPVDVAETFGIWNLLNSKYFEIEKINLWKNYVHDDDLSALLGKFNSQIQRRIKQLERKLAEYSINGPVPNVKDIKTSHNTEVLFDRFIARDTFLLIQEALGLVCKGVKNSITNDTIREFMMMMVIEVSQALDQTVKLLKLKGWLDVPPLYPNIPQDVEERIDVGEAQSLWDHLTYRYDNINQTNTFAKFAYDKDFQILLNRGHNLLQKQITILEKEILYFGIPLPQPTTEIIASPESTEMLKDREMYRTIWLGMQAAIFVHYESVKRSIINDRIRKLFMNLLKDEIHHMDSFVKYGKAKGWLNPIPYYSMENET